MKVTGTALPKVTMPSTLLPMPTFAFPSHDVRIRTNVEYMSIHLLGKPYSDVEKIIYPTPPYKSFLITKRSGAPRLIQEPRERLKLLQMKVLGFLEEHASKPKPCAHGFTRKRSIVTNARKHCSPQVQHLLNIDLKDFFPSISFFRVRGIFQKKPFECSHNVATVLAQICTHRNELPQGAPTSPFLANLVSRRLDTDLMNLARRHRATYTRYADDLTFSFSVRASSRLPENICAFESGGLTLGHELLSIIERNNFQVNPAKSRISTRHHRLEVTGVTINEFPNVKRDFIDRIRGGLHAWGKYGYEKAQTEWKRRVTEGKNAAYEKRPWKRQWRKHTLPQLINVLWGKLLYVRMVRGAHDVIYTRLAERYNELCAKEHALNGAFSYTRLPIEPIVRNSEDAERAVLVVSWMGDYQPSGTTVTEVVGAQGTAFPYRSNNRLITCDHVLRWEGAVNGSSVMTDCSSADVHGATIEVIQPGTGASWPVRVVHRDIDKDLAILEFIGAPPALRHFIGLDAPIRRNETGVLIGYPNWNAGRVANQIGAVVVNRFGRRALQRLEISTMIRQGNSGGPFVDELFRVAGVAQEGATQDSGNDECLCVDELDKWIANVESAVPSFPVP